MVDEIRAAGGKAVANYDSVEDGEKIIETAIKGFGRIDVLLNNAGILRDVSFKNMSDNDWDLIIKVHVTGAYKVDCAFSHHFRLTAKIICFSVPGLHGHIFGSRSMAGLSIPRRLQVCLEALVSATIPLQNSRRLDSPKRSQRRVSSTTLSAMS